MLNLVDIKNLTVEDIQLQFFNLGIFASGYEGRAIALAQSLDAKLFEKKIIFGFKEHNNNSIRTRNDVFYRTNFGEPILLSANDQSQLFITLNDVFNEFADLKEIKILIDYTSMSRLWYSGILSFLRLQNEMKIEVYINYSLGVYSNDFLDYSYSSINSLPGLEGSLSFNNRTLLVLATGFSPYLIRSVIEEIEPNDVIGVYSSSNIAPEYQPQTDLIRSEILNSDIENWLACPINDLEAIFRTYAEITSSNVNEKDIIFLSLGPKIFTIASILVSQRFEQITCLYLETKRQSNDVQHNGKFICNRLSYRP